ncbi:MAG: murein biosynthesis integral membrane protein MurJ [Holosporaceae bacterium]|jgi:putative peptidoglycan lipid II flippase|nr:murein biosynthesis integral membrane protein MurJ [Holosporaceae bacterium]
MGLIRSAFTVGVFILVSRFSGFMREVVMAFSLGVGIYSDAFLVALRIANTFRRIFAEGAFNAAFLPCFSRVLNHEGKKEANTLLSEVFSSMILILVSFSLLVIVFFPNLLRVLVSGFDVLGEKFKISVISGRICFSYLILISITSLFGGVLNTINRFALPAVIHSLLSIFVTIGLLIGYFLKLPDDYTVYIASIGVVLSGIVQCYVLFRSIKKHDFGIWFRTNCWSPRVRKIMKNMLPGIIGAGVWQLNLLVDTTISSHLPTGTITCVNMADRLCQLPLGTLGIAMNTALLPLLSKFIGAGKYEEARIELERGVLLAFFLTFLATTILMSLSEPSVSVAFRRGMFDEECVRITASTVVGFSIGLPAYVLAKVFSSLYFAAGDTKTPVIFAIYSVISNVMFFLLLVPFLKYFGLALATSLSAFFNVFLLVRYSSRKLRMEFSRKFWKKVLSQFIAAICTYLSLTKLSDSYWDIDLGAKAIKWLIYTGFIVAAVTIFFLVAALCLRFTGQKQWKLWKEESWQ